MKKFCLGGVLAIALLLCTCSVLAKGSSSSAYFSFDEYSSDETEASDTKTEESRNGSSIDNDENRDDATVTVVYPEYKVTKKKVVHDTLIKSFNTLSATQRHVIELVTSIFVILIALVIRKVIRK